MDLPEEQQPCGSLRSKMICIQSQLFPIVYSLDGYKMVGQKLELANLELLCVTYGQKRKKTLAVLHVDVMLKKHQALFFCNYHSKHNEQNGCLIIYEQIRLLIIHGASKQGKQQEYLTCNSSCSVGFASDQMMQPEKNCH